MESREQPCENPLKIPLTCVWSFKNSTSWKLQANNTAHENYLPHGEDIRLFHCITVGYVICLKCPTMLTVVSLGGREQTWKLHNPQNNKCGDRRRWPGNLYAKDRKAFFSFFFTNAFFSTLDNIRAVCVPGHQPCSGLTYLGRWPAAI